MRPTWGPSGADRTQVGPMLAPWILLSGYLPHIVFTFNLKMIRTYYVKTVIRRYNYVTLRSVLLESLMLSHAAFLWYITSFYILPVCAIQWRHNGRDSVSNHQHHDCLLNRLFRSRSKKASKLCATGLCAGNSPGTGEFPAQMASYAENVSIWWRHHGYMTSWSKYIYIYKTMLHMLHSLDMSLLCRYFFWLDYILAKYYFIPCMFFIR